MSNKICNRQYGDINGDSQVSVLEELTFNGTLSCMKGFLTFKLNAIHVFSRPFHKYQLERLMFS